MKKNNLFYTTACVASLSAATSFAVSFDPTAEDVADGTLEVKIKIEELVRMSNLVDLDLGTYDPTDTQPSNDSDEFCVYYNNSTDVNITLTSANNGGGGNYNMAGDNDAAQLIPYTVGISNSPSTSQPFAAHTEGTTVKYVTANTASDDDCASVGADTTAISASTINTGFLTEPSDTYRDTITIKIAPGI